MAADYGRDMSCTTSLQTMRYVSGAQLVAEAVYRRLTTPRGMLRGSEEDAEYGLDLTSFVGKGDPLTVAVSLPGKIRAELQKDERIIDVRAEVLSVTEGPATSFEIRIEATTDDGPFELTLGVGDVSVEILNLSAGDDA